MAILTVSSCIPQSLTHRKKNSNASSKKKKKKNSAPSVHTMSSLASSPSSAVRQASPVWLHPLKHALSASPLSFPSYLFTQNHRSIWWNEIPESFVSHLSSLCSLPVLAERGARRWTIFCCAVNFGLHIFYSFAIATCVEEGSQQLCSVRQRGPWALQC